MMAIYSKIIGPYSQTMFNANHWLNRTLNARLNKRNSQSLVNNKHCLNFSRASLNRYKTPLKLD